jgi:hypothetical protein
MDNDWPINVERLRNSSSAPEREAAFGVLPNEFTFMEARRAYNKSSFATTSFLNVYIGAGLLLRVRKGFYKKSAWANPQHKKPH